MNQKSGVNNMEQRRIDSEKETTAIKEGLAQAIPEVENEQNKQQSFTPAELSVNLNKEASDQRVVKLTSQPNKFGAPMWTLQLSNGNAKRIRFVRIGPRLTREGGYKDPLQRESDLINNIANAISDDRSIPILECMDFDFTVLKMLKTVSAMTNGEAYLIGYKYGTPFMVYVILRPNGLDLESWRTLISMMKPPKIFLSDNRGTNVQKKS
jgi:hypothetical protein